MTPRSPSIVCRPPIVPLKGSGCAITEAPTAVSMVGLARIDEGIRKLRSRGGHYGDPNGGKPLHWMINKVQEGKNRAAVCPRKAPPDMQRVGRTSCDEYPFASSYEGGTHLPASQREITWVKVNENKAQGCAHCRGEPVWIAARVVIRVEAHHDVDGGDQAPVRGVAELHHGLSFA